MSQTLPAPAPPSSEMPNSFVGWTVLGICLVITTFAWRDVANVQILDERAHFENQTANTVLNIERALSSYEQALYNAAALIASQAGPHIKWRDYVISHSTEQAMLRMQKIGFARATESDSGSRPSRLRIDRPSVKFSRISSRYAVEDTTSLPRELQPDTLSTNARRHRSTEGIPPVRKDDEQQTTMLMYLPAYADENQNLQGGRAKKLLGYVYTHIVIDDFIEALRTDAARRIRIKFFEGHDSNTESLLYDSGADHNPAQHHASNAEFSKSTHIEVIGHRWNMQFEASRTDFPSSIHSRAEIYILGGGLLLSLSLFALTRSTLRSKKPVSVVRGHSHQELKNQIDVLEACREQEQKRLAQEMHDDLGQLLAAMKMDLAVLTRHVPPHDIKILRCLNSLNELVNTMMTSVRRIISDLPPQALEELGLFDALRSMAKTFEKRHKVRCRICLPVNRPGIAPRAASAIYRMTQEALNNVAKHACATSVEIKMEIVDNSVLLSIADNGKGFSPRALQKAGSFGLIGMRERAASLNGRMNVESASGTGTTIYFTLPLDDKLHCCTNLG